MQNHSQNSIAIYSALLSSISLSLSQVQLKLLIQTMRPDHKLWNHSIIADPGFWACLSMLLIFGTIGTLLWIYAIRIANLSELYWTTALCYIAVPLFAALILKEPINAKQIFSYLVITLGIILSK